MSNQTVLEWDKISPDLSSNISINERCKAIARIATACLYREASLYPKPGLVSPEDSGSHQDMDYNTFLLSIHSLKSYFYRISLSGTTFPSFASLRALGMEAERDMMSVTGGVNTHRGAIFNIGLLCAAAGFLDASKTQINCANLSQIIFNEWGEDILASAKGPANGELSHGLNVEKIYGIQGARYESVHGFPTVIAHGLPAYQSTLEATGSVEKASIHALFCIMENLSDTNIIWRAGIAGLTFVQSSAREFLQRGSVFAVDWREDAIRIHREFVARNLSPGGTADLLGVTFFMHSLT